MSIRNGMPAADLPEVTWRKSRRSGPQGGNCVEVANLPDGRVAVRNSRHPAGPALVFTSAEWVAFVSCGFNCLRKNCANYVESHRLLTPRRVL